MADTKAQIKKLEKEVVSLKNIVNNIENYLSKFPKYSDYIPKQDLGDLDELFDESVKIIHNYGRVTASLLQRKLAIGYNRAARIVDQLFAEGLIQKSNPPKSSKVLKDKIAKYLMSKK